MNSLAKNIPLDIVCALHPSIKRQFRVAITVVWSIQFLWYSWFFMLPLSKFPMTFGSERYEAYGLPDYGTGKFSVCYRRRAWAIDYI